MMVEDSDELDRCSALFTVAAYVVANLDDQLPREGEYPDDGIYPPASAASVPHIAQGIAVITTFLYKMIV